MVSECYEYIWGIKYRVEVVDRAAECMSNDLCTASIFLTKKSFIFIYWNFIGERKKDLEMGIFRFDSIGGRDSRNGEFPHMASNNPFILSVIIIVMLMEQFKYL